MLALSISEGFTLSVTEGFTPSLCEGLALSALYVHPEPAEGLFSFSTPLVLRRNSPPLTPVFSTLARLTFNPCPVYLLHEIGGEGVRRSDQLVQPHPQAIPLPAF